MMFTQLSYFEFFTEMYSNRIFIFHPTHFEQQKTPRVKTIQNSRVQTTAASKPSRPRIRTKPRIRPLVMKSHVPDARLLGCFIYLKKHE